MAYVIKSELIFENKNSYTLNNAEICPIKSSKEVITHSLDQFLKESNLINY